MQLTGANGVPPVLEDLEANDLLNRGDGRVWLGMAVEPNFPPRGFRIAAARRVHHPAYPLRRSPPSSRGRRSFRRTGNVIA